MRRSATRFPATRFPATRFLLVPGILSMLFFSACDDRRAIPGDVIPLDSMTSVMMDVMVADQYSLQYQKKDSTIKDKLKASQELLDKVFAIHHISREEFKKSLEFYESRPDLTRRIYDSLTIYTNKHRGDIYAPKQVKPTPLPVK